MRRRRKGNPLLVRMMVISLVIVLAMLPILGYLGAFKVVKQEYMQVTMVPLPPPPPIPKDAAVKKAHPKTINHHGSEHIPGSSRPLPVHVAAAAAPSNGTEDDDNAIVNGTNTDIGKPPTALPGAPAAPVTPTPAPPVAPPPPPPPPPVAQIVQPKLPSPPPAQPDQMAEVIDDTQVKPQIPDDLRDADLDAQFQALFTVHVDGTADVKMLASTGHTELDQLALQAARQWRFHPAIHDGKAVESYRRLVVEFQVS